jgi:predicted  nucleic acid-binding Zn-ribbon protein
MSTLRDNLNILLELQQVDSQRDKVLRLRSNLDAGDKLTKDIASARSDYDKRKAEVAATNGSLKDAELELAGIEKRIKDYEAKSRAGSVTNTREMMNLEKEFNQLNRQRTTLDDKILTLMDQSETQTKTLKAAETLVATLERDLVTLKASFHEELVRLDGQTNGLNAKRSELSKLVTEPALLKRYEGLRIKPGNSGIAIAHTNEKTCGACHMQIGSIAVTQAAGGDELAICENCGRIMA